MGGIPHGAGAERDGEGAAEARGQGLTAAPMPHSPAPLRGEEVGEGGWGEGVLGFFPLFLTSLA